MTKRKDISQEDIDTWQEYIKNQNDIIDKDKVAKTSLFNKGRFKFDLHGYTLFEANNKVKEIILFCIKNKFQEILFITGKGIHSQTKKNVYVSENLSKLRFSVPEFINSSSDLMKHVFSISKANIIDGGEGAIIVKLKKTIK